MNRYTQYLRTALRLGFVQHVHRVSESWGSSVNGNPAMVDAAWEIQKLLIGKYGYHECPSCYWATEKKDEHLLDPNGYCFQQHLAEVLRKGVRDVATSLVEGAIADAHAAVSPPTPPHTLH